MYLLFVRHCQIVLLTACSPANIRQCRKIPLYRYIRCIKQKGDCLSLHIRHNEAVQKQYPDIFAWIAKLARPFLRLLFLQLRILQAQYHAVFRDFRKRQQVYLLIPDLT